MAKVYVGTYRKYNEGSLKGKWISLDNCNSYDDFIAECKKVHSDEADPEYMIQDSEDFPDGLDCMEWISREDFTDIKNAIDAARAFSIIDYSENAIAVTGDTKPIKDKLKALGGRFNPRLKCGAGWIFPKKKLEEVKLFLDCNEIEQCSVDTSDSAKYAEWLREYADTTNDSMYYLKEYAGAVKIGDSYYLIDKPHIENRFCFRDEGPEYELYNALCSDDSKMKEYFIKENLSKLKSMLDNIEKGKRMFLKVNSSNSLNIQTPYYAWQADDCEGTEITPEERNVLADAVRFGLLQFEKRLNTYLKKYGVSKIHTWSYWADA